MTNIAYRLEIDYYSREYEDRCCSTSEPIYSLQEGIEWILQKDSFYGRIVRKYRVNKYGKLTETDNFFSVPTKADFLNWCADRGIEWKENV